MKKKKKRIAFFKLIALVAVVLMASVFYKQYSGLKEYKNEIDSLNSQIAEQKEYSKELDTISKEYASIEYVEKYARSLGLVKPNEKIFRNYNDRK